MVGNIALTVARGRELFAQALTTLDEDDVLYSVLHQRQGAEHAACAAADDDNIVFHANIVTHFSEKVKILHKKDFFAVDLFVFLY